MKKPFDCDCIIDEIDLVPVAEQSLFLLNTAPRTYLLAEHPIDACPVCKPERMGAGVIVLDLFKNNHDEVILLLRHNRQVAVWVLRPNGAYDAGQDCGAPVNLAAALRDYARELGEIPVAHMPPDDKLFLYRKSNMEVLRFRGSNYVLGDSSAYGGDTVDLVRILYNAATAAEPPRKQESSARPLNELRIIPLSVDIADRLHIRIVAPTLVKKEHDFTISSHPCIAMDESGNERNLVADIRAMALNALAFSTEATDGPPDEKPLDTPAAQALRSRVAGHLTLATVFRPIYVVWDDAVQHSGYFDPHDGDSFPLETMETIGYLIGETPAAIVVAQSVSAHKAGDLLVIPKTAIVKMETMN